MVDANAQIRHHLWHGSLRGALTIYIEAFPLTQYSMYGAVAAAQHQEGKWLAYEEGGTNAGPGPACWLLRMHVRWGHIYTWSA